MSGRLSRLARRLGKRLPASSGHLEGTLRESEVRLDALSRGLEDTNRLLDSINERLREATNHGLPELQQRLEHTQGLAARVYERQDGWPERLAAIRGEPGYEEAFSGE